MMRRTRSVVLWLLLPGLVSPAFAAAEGRWLHLRVQQAGAGADQVHLDLPLGAVEAMLPFVAGDELRGGKLELGEVGELDLREVLAALRASPDAPFVALREGGESVRIAKERGFLVIHAEDRDAGSPERVHVRLPLPVVEALLGGDPEQLDLSAALRALAGCADEELVRVESPDETVRIWIDSAKSGPRAERAQ